MHPVKSVIDVRKVLRERVGHFIQLLVANAARRITQTDSGLFRQRDFERYDVSRSVAVAVTIKASSRILRWPCLVLESATQLFVHPKALRRRMNCPETFSIITRILQLVSTMCLGYGISAFRKSGEISNYGTRHKKWHKTWHWTVNFSCLTKGTILKFYLEKSNFIPYLMAKVSDQRSLLVTQYKALINEGKSTFELYFRLRPLFWDEK